MNNNIIFYFNPIIIWVFVYKTFIYVLFYTGLNTIIIDKYTDAFLARFPILFTADYLVSIILAIIVVVIPILLLCGYLPFDDKHSEKEIARQTSFEPTPFEEKQARLQELNDHVNKWDLINNKKYEGKVVPVLIEGYSKKNKNLLMGYTDTMKLVNVKADSSYLGKIVNVKITDIKTWSMDGELVD